MHIGQGSQVVATIAPSRKMLPVWRQASRMAFTSAWAVMSVVSTHRIVRRGEDLAVAGDRTAKRALARGQALAALVDRKLHQLGGVHGGQVSSTSRVNRAAAAA